MSRIKRFFANNRLIFAAFFIPVILMVIAFALTGIYPFGNNQIAVIDMYHQYLPFLSELQNKLQHGESLFYTWNGAGGSNFWNLFSYYGASPLNLLLILFPARLISEGVTVVLLIKIGLAGAFMTIYLRSEHKRCDMGTVAFGALYALCAYVMGYCWCIMWIDAVALLPLIILGLNRLVRREGFALYTVALALVVFINYYIAIMVCIFILFYYPVIYFTEKRVFSGKECLCTTLKAVGFSLLGIAMAAVMLLPTYLSMQYTYYISSSFPETWSFYNSVLEVLNQLMPNAQLTSREGLPNLYTGLLVVMMCVFYVLDKKINLREKILKFSFLAFLFFSLNVNALDFIWHGFHYPNQLPFRYSFAVSFVLVTMAYKAFIGMERVKVNAIWETMAALLGWLALCQTVLKDTVDNADLYMYGGAILVVAYSVVMVLYRKKRLVRTSFVLLIALVAVFEMGMSTYSSMSKLGNSSRSDYFENYGDVKKLVSLTKDDFARVEIDNNFMLNCPAFYHYKGLSQFSSSINADVTTLMEKIGLEGEPGKNRYNYNPTNPVTDAILGVKYLIGKVNPLDDYDYKMVKSYGDSYLYKNKKPLAIGYVAPDSILTWDTSSDNPFTVLDDYVRAASGNRCGRVFNTVQPDDISAGNAELSEDGEGVWQEEMTNAEADSVVDIDFVADKAQKYYVFVEASGCDTITIIRSDMKTDINVMNDCGSVINVGPMKKGEKFTVHMEQSKAENGTITCHVATLDENAWAEAYGMIAANPMKISDFGASYVKGTVTADKSGVLATSIPYEKGWSAKIDGKNEEIDSLLGDAFISLSLSEGTHEVEFSFRPPGFIVGLATTLAACLILIALVLFGRRRKSAILLATEQGACPDDAECRPEESDCNKE